MDKRFGVILVGSGADGSTLARCLAPSGNNILILERGDWPKRLVANWDAAAVFEHSCYASPDTWYDRNARPFQCRRCIISSVEGDHLFAEAGLSGQPRQAQAPQLEVFHAQL
jgi:choline dehydrogenase-like flavoprotein